MSWNFPCVWCQTICFMCYARSSCNCVTARVSDVIVWSITFIHPGQPRLFSVLIRLFPSPHRVLWLLFSKFASRPFFAISITDVRDQSFQDVLGSWIGYLNGASCGIEENVKSVTHTAARDTHAVKLLGLLIQRFLQEFWSASECYCFHLLRVLFCLCFLILVVFSLCGLSV